METGTNNSVDLPLNAPEVNRSPDTNTSTPLPIKDDQCKLDQLNLVEQNSMDKSGSPQGLDKNTDVETGTITVETVETIVMEKADSDNSKPSAATDNPGVNGSKTVNDTIASVPPTNILDQHHLKHPRHHSYHIINHCLSRAKLCWKQKDLKHQWKLSPVL